MSTELQTKKEILDDLEDNLLSGTGRRLGAMVDVILGAKDGEEACEVAGVQFGNTVGSVLALPIETSERIFDILWALQDMAEEKLTKKSPLNYKAS